jgi:peroxiredoxin Q/BCP
VVVLGCSPDTVEAQAGFKAKNGLPFTLLADTEHQVADAYGAWVPRERDGVRFMGIQRSTVIIGPDGTVKQVWSQVVPAGHSKELLAALG